jgi:hypothetical protein
MPRTARLTAWHNNQTVLEEVSKQHRGVRVSMALTQTDAQPCPMPESTGARFMSMTEPPKMTKAEIVTLVAEAVSWVNQMREHYRPVATSLAEPQKAKMRPFFPTELLERVRVVDLSETGEYLPYPPFYSRVKAGGSRVVPDAVHMDSIPFVDLVAFGQKATDRTLFNALVHVTQFTILGVERFMELYVRGLNKSGRHYLISLEGHAYHLDTRFTKDPSDIFSVTEEVQQWAQSGRYER